MAGNIPGTNNSVLPGVYTQVETQSTGVSIPGGTRIVAIIGEGVKEEVIVAAANGGGQDGFNSDYTSVSNSDGRHFMLSGLITSELPIVANTFNLFKKGNGGEAQLIGKEEAISTTPLDSAYDFRVDLNSGKIELQVASIKVQDSVTGSQYTTPTGNSANKGSGTITDLEVSNPNSPPEKWVVKCVSVQKDSSGNAIANTAKFIAFGSISGNKLVNGSHAIWQSDGYIVDNKLVKFAINQDAGQPNLTVGDSFTFEVNSGVLAKDESLRAEYIPSSNINDPTFLTSLNDIAVKHGTPSVTNTLSLGAQLAIANGAPGVMCVQARPSAPKRTSYNLPIGSSATFTLDPNSTDINNFKFKLPSGVVPDTESEIHFFLTDTATKKEKQYLPNKILFYSVDSADEGAFKDDTQSPNAFSYTVTKDSNNDHYVLINKSIAIANNSLRITIIDQKDAGFYDAGWLEALASLEAQDVDIIVPLPRQNISAIFQNALTHCKVASSIKNKRERVLLCGAIRGLTPDNLIGSNPKLVAVEDIGVLEGIQGDTDTLTGTKEDLANYSVSNAFGYGSQSFRSVYFYPDEIVVQANGENKFVDGFYMAAAAGGYLSANTNIAMPLTNKVLTGFTILSKKKLTNLKKEQMADSGITVVDPVQGGGRVVWGKTTTKSGYPEEEEISIVFIRDRIAKAMRDSFAGYIGLPEDDSIVATLTARAVSVLNSFVSQNLITQYTGLQISRDSVDPRQWNVSVKCQPNYPVNFIFIKVSLGVI